MKQTALLLAFLFIFTNLAFSQYSDPNIDRIPDDFWDATTPTSVFAVVTDAQGFDNFNIGTDFGEPHLSMNPLNPLNCFAAYNTNGAHYVTNGLDWSASFSPSFGVSTNGDPVTAFDSLGNLYYENMVGGVTGTRIIKSLDGGVTFGAAVTGNTGNDKNWLAADQTNGPYKNYIYTVMTPGNFKRSTDGGASFLQTFSATNTLPGAMVCVGANKIGPTNVSGGAVYYVTSTGSSFAATHTFYCSNDGGATFSTKSVQNFVGYVGTEVGGRNSVQNMRTRPYPFIAADNSFGTYRGRFYLIYANNNPAGNGNKPNIYCRYSTDQGATFSAPVLINDDPNPDASDQFFPAIWCDKETGRLYCKWFDTRDDPSDATMHVYASYSDDGGVTWSQNQKITTAPATINCTTCPGGGTPRYQGDYDAIASNSKTSVMAWTDMRAGTFGSYTAYFPDFGMLLTPSVNTVYHTNSNVNFLIEIPAVKSYTDVTTFTASITPVPGTGNIEAEFINGTTLSTYPNTKTVKIKTTGTVTTGNYTVKIKGAGSNGTPVHERTVTLTVNSTPPPIPVVTSFSPQSGPVGTTVTITGSGFNTTPANNIVFFGAAMASVSAASATSLTVNVPAGANYHYISVTNLSGNLTGYSSMPFIITFPGGCKPDFAAKTDFTSGTTPRFIGIGDIDGDGKSDLAVANLAISTVSVFRNISTSGVVSFAPKVDFATGSGPASVSISDIDGDGKPDMAVGNFNANTISVFRNTSTSGTINAGSFAAKVDFATGTGTQSVRIGDIDGDGKPELIAGNYTNNNISVLRNTSTSGVINAGSFAAKVDFTTGTNPVSISIGDIDGDGKSDLAVANYSSNTLSVFRNTSASGAISLSAKVDFTTGTNPVSVSVGDIDGNGKPDLAIANYTSNTISVFRNSSTSGVINSGSLAAKVDFTTGTGPYSVGFGDIDGDGKPDMAASNSSSNSVSAFRNTSTSGVINAGSFAAKVDFTAGTTPYILSIGDLDGDGKPEVAATNVGSNNISVFRNLSTPAVLQSNATGNGNPVTNGSVTPDITNHTDFGNILVNGNLIRTYTFQNTSTDSLDVDSIKMTGADLSLFTPGSITPAGKIAPGSSKTFTVTFTPTSVGIKTATVNIYSNIASGTACQILQTYTFALKGTVVYPVITSFSPQSGHVGTTVTITGSGFNTTPANNIVFFGAAKASVSAASETSLTVSVPAGANYQNISVTNLNGNLTGYSSMPFNVTFPGGCKPDFASKVDFKAGANPRFIRIGDIDGDGKPDLVFVNAAADSLSVYKNTSTTGVVSYAARVSFQTGNNPQSVSIGDIDGDGKPDLAVANGSDNNISVFRNTSTPGVVSFAARVNYASGSSPNFISICDIDKDGKPELAVTNSNSNTLSVFRNTSTSGVVSFSAKVDFATGTSPRSNYFGDIDGDGKTDLVAGNYTSSTLSVFRNTSTTGVINAGSFAAKVDFTTGTNPRSVGISDIDGDGKPDLVSANEGGNNVSALRNTSASGVINAGSFAAKVDFTAGTTPFSVIIGDIDGDSKPDLAVANEGSNTVSAFRNTSVSGSINSGSFTSKVDYTTGTSPRSVSIGDIDGDGKPELAIANTSSDTVSVLRNLSTPAVLQSNATGNGNPVTNGSVTPDITNHTDFGNILVNGNLIRTYTFQNTSTDSLAVDSIKMTGADLAMFTPGSITPAGKIAPGSSKTFNVTFAPTSSGIKTATVNIYSNINSGTACQTLQTYTFAVNGTGVPNSTINISVIPEGFYNGGIDELNASDTVRAYLHSTVYPFNVVDNAIAVISNTTFTGTFVFATAPTGTYYIKVVHRNCLETWSKAGGELFTAGTTMSYNFTTAASQAFGDNQVQTAVFDNINVFGKGKILKDASTIRFGIFSGDLNQDGTVDAGDLSQAENDAANSLSGYVQSDVTGDDFVDAADLSIVENNASTGVSAIYP